MNLRKIKVSIFFELLVFLDLLCWYHFFYIIKVPSFVGILLSKYNYSIISSGFGLFCSIICMEIYRKLFGRTYKRCLTYAIVIIFVYFFMIIYTLIHYPNQSLFGAFRLGGNYLHIFWVPTYFCIIHTTGGIKGFLKKLNCFCFIWYILIISQFLLYNMSGTLLFDFSTLASNSAVRLYGLRMTAGCFGTIIILYNYIQLYDQPQNKDKIFSIIQIVLGLFAIIYVQQTRMLVVVLFACIFICVVLCEKQKKIRNYELLLLAGIILALFFTRYFDNLYNELTSIDVKEGGVSITNRLYSLSYYWECFLRNPFLGNSLVTEATPYFNVVHGGMGYAYYSDVGIIGVLGQIGLCASVFLLLPFGYVLKTTKLVKHRGDSPYEYNILLISCVYIILTSLTLIVTDNGREPLFSIIIAFCLYCRNQLPNHLQINRKMQGDQL